ncbi:MAG: DEAD/DEAH box helicase [Proteobacteria bacterium]|nr:DEAD/DEAH box helicase [Pseudomonadota bacterium]
MNEVKHFIESQFEQNIRARFKLKETEGSFFDFPKNLHPELATVLENQGIKRLYSHQREAFDSIVQNRDTLLISQTASGKTLSFFLPILNEYVQSKAPFSVLLLYPTKALSRDQENTFGELMTVVEKSGRLGTFDGDTPRDERARIQRSSDFIITNPDMLHGGILPNHNRKWKDFLSRLRYIVVDEVHIYRGAFGSHVSNVFRRLLRVCRIHGSHPVFVCSSATVGNPKEHVKALFDRDFHLVDKDGAPRPGRELYFVNPSLVHSHGHALYRKGPASISIPLIREAAGRNIRTICFCRSRQEVERLYRAVTDRFPRLKKVVKPYRGGLLPNERRRLERDLVDGKITAIITTNALELGIDIGDLELCVLSGHPGSIASFWQQAGRVGRKDKPSLIVYVAKDNPIDQYLAHHPEFITQTPVEQALLNADNPYILLQHLPCMAHEHPLRETEPGFESRIFEEAVTVLKENGTVVPYRDTHRYALQDYPARGVNLRGMTDYNVEIYCGTEVIGELDPIGARGELYKDAIYQHLGRRYMSMDLDLEKKLCRVEAVDVDYYTEAHWEGRLEMTDREDGKRLRDAQLDFGIIHYNKQPKLYKKIRERSYENIGYGPITLPAFEYDTTGFCLLPPKAWSDALEGKDKRYIGAALYGLSYLLRHTASAFCMADVKDIETDVSLIEVESQRWKSALYMFDAIEGGVGYAEKAYETFETCLEMCRDILGECGCLSGCPSCVPPLPPGVANQELETLLVESNASIVCTESLLTALLEGGIVVPEVKTVGVPSAPAVQAPPEDLEKKKIQRQLGRAAKILQKKRERLH